MKFYRVELLETGAGNAGASLGYDWFTTKAAAASAARKSATTMMVVDIRPTRAGILEALNNYAAHPDNG